MIHHEEYNSPKLSCRLLFKKKMVNRPGHPDRVVEFVDPNSGLAKAIDREYWVRKTVEKKKRRAADVATEIQNAGFKKFRVQREPIDFWKADDAKDPAKGFGVEVAGVWYWYESWVKRCLERPDSR
ncbi:MAG: hypothetical protein ACREPL_09730 [Rhodanobacteraceae bacterium]